ncbi:unnamed protein product [Closterium sp. NIES-65]|nr:unnamed protein product [Closterium sp. NIES-65]
MELSVAAQPPLRLAPCHLVALLPSPCHPLHCRLLSHRPPFLRPPVRPAPCSLSPHLHMHMPSRTRHSLSSQQTHFESLSSRPRPLSFPRAPSSRSDGPIPPRVAGARRVVVCANHVGGQDEVDVVVAHELVHALDHCRAANLHWPDLQHHACSEIRAANLSGACHMHREFNTRGSDFVFRNGHPARVVGGCEARGGEAREGCSHLIALSHLMPAPSISHVGRQALTVSSFLSLLALPLSCCCKQQCVRRKAQLSVAMNPFCSHADADADAGAPSAATTAATTANGSSANGSCSGSEASSSSSAACMARARAAVDAVWDVCYQDTTPFDRIP